MHPAVVESSSRPVGLGTPFGERQAQASASGFNRASFVNPVETVENLVPVLRGNARPTILHFDAAGVRVTSANTD